MAVAIITLICYLLLFISPDLLALQQADWGSLKFILNIFTHIIGHADFDHFMGNFLFMTPAALYVEHRLGSKKFLLAFCGAAWVGTACFLLSLDSSLPWGLIGSSGGAFGIIALALVLFAESRLWKAILAIFWLFVLLDRQLFNLAFDLMGGVAYLAHIGGAIAGIALGVKELLKSPKVRDKVR